MNAIVVLTILLILTIMIILYKKTIEGYNMGTITQLTAKDPQDTYLTGNVSKYFTYPYGPYLYGYPNYGSMRMKKSARPVYIGQYPYYDALINYT